MLIDSKELLSQQRNNCHGKHMLIDCKELLSQQAHGD
jgi:hypothetical protein